MSDEEKDQFFKELEQEMGEPIAMYTVGEIREGLPNLREPLVGLFYTTEHFFFFQTFPRKNWFINILGSFRKKKEEKPLQIKIPLSALLSVELNKPKGFWGKLFGSPLPLLTVQYDEGDGSPMFLVFSLLTKEKEFADWMSAALKKSI